MLAAAHSTPSISLPVAPGGGQRLVRRVDRDLGHQRQLVVAPRLEVRAHAMRVEHAGLVDHVALLDARGLLDELDAGRHHRLHLAGCDARCVLLVLQRRRTR
jgi:hypothetical protein